MALFCKLCARVNTGNHCLFCGNRILVDAPKYDESIASCDNYEDVEIGVAKSVENEEVAAENVVATEKNSFALGGLILSILPYTSLIGFIFSILGLRKSKKLNGEGKKLSIAGIAVSSLFILSAIASTICMLIFI